MRAAETPRARCTWHIGADEHGSSRWWASLLAAVVYLGSRQKAERAGRG